MKTMHHPFLVGEKLYLRGIEKKDIEGDYFNWLNDEEVTRYMMSGLFPNTPEKMESFLGSIADPQQNVFFAIVDKETDKHIGNVKLGPIFWVHRKAEFGIMIGDKSFWGKGYCTEATRIVARYAFERLNLNRLELAVVAGHDSAITSYKRVGFKEEGCAREQFYAGGKWLDRIYMGLLKKEFVKGSFSYEETRSHRDEKSGQRNSKVGKLRLSNSRRM